MSGKSCQIQLICNFYLKAKHVEIEMSSTDGNLSSKQYLFTVELDFLLFLCSKSIFSKYNFTKFDNWSFDLRWLLRIRGRWSTTRKRWNWWKNRFTRLSRLCWRLCWAIRSFKTRSKTRHLSKTYRYCWIVRWKSSRSTDMSIGYRLSRRFEMLFINLWTKHL